MLNLYINRWTLSAILLTIGIILYALGLEQIAAVGVPTSLGLVLIGGVQRDGMELSSAYLSGVMLGIAGLICVYMYIALPLLVILIYGPLRGKGLKLFWSHLFGVVTPAWVVLPIWFYINHGTVVDVLRHIDYQRILSL